MLRGVFSSHSQPIRTRLGKPRIRLCFVLFLFFQNTVLKIFLVICQKTPHYDQTFLGFVFILKGGKEEDALLQELYAQAAEEYYETMKKSLVQISLKTPQVRGLENEDAELRRLGPSPPVKGVVFFSWNTKSVLVKVRGLAVLPASMRPGPCALVCSLAPLFVCVLPYVHACVFAFMFACVLACSRTCVRAWNGSQNVFRVLIPKKVINNLNSRAQAIVKEPESEKVTTYQHVLWKSFELVSLHCINGFYFEVEHAHS